MDLLDEPTPGQNTPEFTVSEISGAIKRTLEDEFGRVRVKGEVGRVVIARSGHLYFDIKDDRNSLSCTTWKGQVSGLSVVPEEGMEVVATGRLTAYGAQSRYNMNVSEVAVAGQGALMALLEKRKKLLAAEGLFEDARKKPLPYLPEIIGVVTSPTGAVIRDILHRLRDRFPRKVLIWPVAVQGANCAPEVTRAIQGFNAMKPGGALPRPDLIIVARGGGSVEDLWGFNEESVARAAAASDIPLISAVGHETDTTLIDFTSDRRAPTPTAAAEMAVPVRLDMMAWLRETDARLSRGLEQSLGRRKQRLADLTRAMPAPDRLLEIPRQRLDRAGEQLAPRLSALVQNRHTKLAQISGALRPATVSRSLQTHKRTLESLSARLAPALQTRSANKRDRLTQTTLRFRPDMLKSDIQMRRDHLKRTAKSLIHTANTNLATRKDQLTALDRLRQTLGYEATLKRGYTVMRADGAVITTLKQAQSATDLEVQFQDGRLNLSKSANGKPQPPKKAPIKKPKTPPPDQGSLF